LFRKLVAKFLGLYTEEDIELIVLEKCQKLKKIEEEKYRKTFLIPVSKIETLFSFYASTNNRFLGFFPLFTKDNTLLWTVVKVPPAQVSTFYYPYYDGAVIEVIDPLFSSISVIHNRIAYLYFDMKGPDIHITDIVTTKQRCGIGTFLLQLLEHLATYLRAVRKIGRAHV